LVFGSIHLYLTIIVQIGVKMGLRLNSNAISMAIAKNINKNADLFNKEALRLSSGKRIVTAGDDPAGAAIATKLKANIAGLNQAKRNTNQALSLVQTGEGALNEINNILIRLREIAIQGANETLVDEDRRLYDLEYKQLRNEVERISQVTYYNGIPLLTGKRKKLDFQVGTHNGKNNVISLDLKNISTTNRALKLGDQGVYDVYDSHDSLDEIDSALSKVSKQRAYLGALQSRLGFTASHLDSMAFHKEDAREQIEGVDYAETISNMVRGKIRQNFSVAALAQANSMPAMVLKLL